MLFIYYVIFRPDSGDHWRITGRHMLGPPNQETL